MYKTDNCHSVVVLEEQNRGNHSTNCTTIPHLLHLNSMINDCTWTTILDGNCVSDSISKGIQFKHLIIYYLHYNIQ